MVRCVICGGEREAYKDCASCAEKRAAGLIPPEMTPEVRKAARRTGAITLATSDQFSEAERRHTAGYLYDQATKLARHRTGRKGGARNKKTSHVEAQFDRLLVENPDCSAEEIRTLKGPKSIRAMATSTVARHWKKAKERAAK